MQSITGAGEMAAAQLRDRRRNLASARLLDCLFAGHAGSFSSTVGEAGRQAAHRLFAAAEVEANDLLSGHIAATRKRSAQAGGGRLLVLQDTTDFDYSGHHKTTGLGSVGRPPRCGMGLQAHAAVAATEDGLPLGVVDLEIWSRPVPEQSRSKDERNKIKKSKPTHQKESRKWLDCIKRVEQQIPEAVQLLFVQDREADMFELFAQKRRETTDLLVRAAQPRRVQTIDEEGAASQQRGLFDAAASAPLLGQVSVEVPASQSRMARTVALQVRAQRILLLPPQTTAGTAWSPVPLWLVSASEIGAPEGEPALSWTLLSTLAADTFEAACRLIGFYARRWLIERLHFILKSGLNAEGLRFDDAHSLANGLALYYIAAWRLLYLTHLARIRPNDLASTCFEATELEVLTLLSREPVNTLNAAVTAIARLGGYRPSKKGGPPGVKTLWLGLRKLEAMAEGFSLARSVT